MLSLYDNQSVIFDTWDRGYITNALEWSKIIEDWFNSLGDEKVKIEFERISIHQSENLGFASSMIHFQALSGEGIVLRSMKNRITVGFSKFTDGWKVVHQHMSAPVSSEDLTAILKI